MSTQKSRVTALTPTESFDYQGKKFYKFAIAFENGVTGIVNTVSQDGSPWKVGEEKEFTSEHDPNKNITKIRAVSPGASSGGGWGKGGYKKNEKLECASYALSYAKDLAMDKVITEDKILSKAEEFFSWLVSKGGIDMSPSTETK